MIKAICFDLDGVYFTKGSFLKFKEVIGKDSTVEKTDFVFYKSDQIANFKKGVISENEFWDYVRKELNTSLTNDEISNILRESYSVDQNVAEIVRKVRNLGYKTCLCSNNFETRIRELNTKFDFLKDFDVQVLSFKVGAIKPDKKIFEKLIRQSGVLPEEIIYSDDTFEKLQGAKDLGINVFVYENFPQFLKTLSDFGVKVDTE
jgi:putative hydrolase of the HAD superfamily